MKKRRNYLICYDIRDARRLAKVARHLTKVALRIQNSVFFLPDATDREVDTLCEALIERIDTAVDDVKVYTMRDYGLHAGTGVDLRAPFILV